MADQKQKQQQQNQPGSSGNIGNDDDPRHAPESGEPTETGPKSQAGPDARGQHGGDRDESGRQGRSK